MTAQGAGATAIVVRVGELETRARIVVLQRPASLEVDDTLLRVPESERLCAQRPRGGRAGQSDRRRRCDLVGAGSRHRDGRGADVVGISPGRTSLTAMAGSLQLRASGRGGAGARSITVLGWRGTAWAGGRPLPVPVAAQIVSRTGRPMAGVLATLPLGALRRVGPSRRSTPRMRAAWCRRSGGWAICRDASSSRSRWTG